MAQDDFLQWLQRNAPANYRRGNRGKYTAIAFGLAQDATWQALDEAGLASWLLEPTSPNDVLPYKANERRLPRYAGETADQHRQRLHAAWTLWPTAGTPSGVIGQLEYAGYAEASIMDDVPVGGDPSRNIPPYSASSEWPYQFIVLIALSAAKGTGAVAARTALDQNPSVLLSQEQLDTVRAIITQFKAVDWRCSEIVVILNLDDGFVWDDGTHLWDDGWTWDDSSVVVERYPFVNS
jgi:hypothetical protein